MLKLTAIAAAATVSAVMAGSPWDPQYTQQAQAMLNQMNLTVSF